MIPTSTDETDFEHLSGLDSKLISTAVEHKKQTMITDFFNKNDYIIMWIFAVFKQLYSCFIVLCMLFTYCFIVYELL